MNDNQQFELLDFLVIITAMVQFDDHDNSRAEFKYLNNKLNVVEKKLDAILKFLEKGEWLCTNTY